MDIPHLQRVTPLLVAIVAAWAGGCHGAELKIWPVSFVDEPEVKKTEQTAIQQTAPVENDKFIETLKVESMPVLASVPRTSEVRYSVNIREAVMLAMGWHPVIKRAEREHAQSKESINEAEAGWFPSLSTRVKSGIEQDNFRQENNKSNTFALNASQMLYDFGKTSSKVELAKAATNYSEANLNKNTTDIAYETANSFVQAVRYQQLVNIAQVQVEGLSAINVLAEKRATSGASSESDYSQSKVRLATAVALLHDYEAQSYRWNSILDNETNRTISASLNPHLPDGMVEACYRVDAENLMSPAIELAQTQIDMAIEQVKSNKAEYFPVMSLNPTWEYELENEKDNRGNRTKKGEWGIFINVNAPLYEGGARLSRTRQAQLALSASRYNLDKEKTEAHRKIVESTSQISSLNESLTAKKDREKESIRTRDLYKLQYIELGNRSFSDLLSAESEIHQTRMDILNSKYTIANLSIDCLYYSGNLVDYFNN